jgi:hypothetical protein
MIACVRAPRFADFFLGDSRHRFIDLLAEFQLQVVR